MSRRDDRYGASRPHRGEITGAIASRQLGRIAPIRLDTIPGLHPAYEGDDQTCTPKVYTVGMTFVDEGGEHVHVIRNEGAVEARTITVQLLPAGAPRRIDAPNNPSCTF